MIEKWEKCLCDADRAHDVRVEYYTHGLSQFRSAMRANSSVVYEDVKAAVGIFHVLCCCIDRSIGGDIDLDCCHGAFDGKCIEGSDGLLSF